MYFSWVPILLDAVCHLPLYLRSLQATIAAPAGSSSFSAFLALLQLVQLAATAAHASLSYRQ
jgi:hypothetical protein